MKNLAGNKESDKFIQIELEKGKIPFEKIDTPNGECQYTIIGKLKNWTFTRAWRYWIAKTEEKNALPLPIALEMHNKMYPDEMLDHDQCLYRYGNSIRVGGHCGCPSPDKYDVTYIYHIDTQEGLNEFARVLNNMKQIGSEYHSPQREEDVQKLCNGILSMSAETWDNPNGGYETSCPFCSARVSRGGGDHHIWASMSELEHDTDCPYLIAKDLSTNLNQE